MFLIFVVVFFIIIILSVIHPPPPPPPPPLSITGLTHTHVCVRACVHFIIRLPNCAAMQVLLESHWSDMTGDIFGEYRPNNRTNTIAFVCKSAIKCAVQEKTPPHMQTAITETRPSSLTLLSFPVAVSFNKARFGEMRTP